ncbi:MAG: HD-GYP domain-containing protein [Magnetococcales bacterium]|nr:HD-GYP domain-containing protein [Magnetococcales bacterium]
MIKKITIDQLQPGMFLHNADSAWNDDLPIPQSGMINKELDVQSIRKHGVKEVYIDTQKGSDAADAPTEDEVQAELAAQMMELGEGEAVQQAAPARFADKKAPMSEELAKASSVKKQARQLVGNVLEDARLGKQVPVGPVKDVVEGMVDSMFRNEDAMLSLSQIKQKDEYTFMHSVNVGVFLMAFCRSMEMDEQTIIDVGVGALLHDIGKMRTPPEVLNKPGRLTDEEFQIMRDHVVYSNKILTEAPGISEAAIQVASQHHERFDGTGYPHNLKGDDIDLFGQMSAIVDVYDAITSDRCYHKGMIPHVALQKMLEWSKHHFKVELYQSFVKCVGIYPLGTLVRLKNGLLGVVVESSRESLLHPVLRIIIDANKRRKLRPTTVNLMDKRQNSEGYVIIQQESTRRWGVDPKRFMPQPELYD